MTRRRCSPPRTTPSATTWATACRWRRPAKRHATPIPVVVANILASALDVLAETLASHVAPGGRIALSGILAGQEGPLLGRYGAWFDDLAVTREGDWIRIDGARR